MVDFEVHLHANRSCCSFFLSRSWRAVQGVSGFVWRGSSCLLTRVLLCFNNVSPRCISTLGQQRRGPRWPRLDGPGFGSGGSKSNSCPVPPPSPSNNMHTQTHARTHAHLHWRRASLSACSTLLSPYLPSSFLSSPRSPSPDLLFCLCSRSDPQTTTSTFPPTSCCFLSPPGFSEGSPCAVSLASMPLSVVLSAWSFHWPGLTGTWALGGLVLHPPPPPQDPQLRGRLLPSSHASSSFFTGISCWTHT